MEFRSFYFKNIEFELYFQRVLKELTRLCHHTDYSGLLRDVVEKMLTVKVTTNFKWCLERQTPNNSGKWGGCRFLINQEVAECDYWVVFDGLLKSETTKCPRENTILITGEPPEVKGYDKHFLAQFGTVISCNRSLQHPNLINSQQGLPWMIGAELDADKLTWSNFKSFEELSRPIVNKTKLLSVIASSKVATKGHVIRSGFIEALALELGASIDVFGLGRVPVIDKWQAIVPYRYHLAIENSSVSDYWTEKLADALIGEAVPIYYGCPNIQDYFSSGAIQLIDINQPKVAIDRIKNIIKSDTWRLQRSNILMEKNKLLNEYNVFSLLDRFISCYKNRRPGRSVINMKPEMSCQSNWGRIAALLKRTY